MTLSDNIHGVHIRCSNRSKNLSSVESPLQTQDRNEERYSDTSSLYAQNLCAESAHAVNKGCMRDVISFQSRLLRVSNIYGEADLTLPGKAIQSMDFYLRMHFYAYNAVG